MTQWIKCDMNTLPEVGTIARVYINEYSDIYSRNVEKGKEVEIIAHVKSACGTPLVVFMVKDEDVHYVRQAIGRCFERQMTENEIIDKRVNEVYLGIECTVSRDAIREMIVKGIISK